MISFKVSPVSREKVDIWLRDNDILGDVSYDWISGILTFGNEDDANAFYLVFGIPRYKLLIELILENEENHN